MPKIFLSNSNTDLSVEPKGKPDTKLIHDASKHLEADSQNIVWIDGNLVQSSEGKLCVNGVVTSHSSLRALFLSNEWPEEL